MIQIPRDSYKGQRCFVLGSGPSVSQTDLSVLDGEIVICVNESYKALSYDPTFICIGDKDLWPKVCDIYAGKNSQIICGSGTNGKCGSEYSGKNLVARLELDARTNIIDNGFNWDLEKPIHKGWNVIPEVVLPFVNWAGFLECYLVGCDCTNSGYFYVESLRGKGFQKVDDRVMKVYQKIAQLPLPTKIYNATVGGKLEHFPRVDLNSLRQRELLVVGYYTPDRNYPELAKQMKDSVEAVGVECVIRERASLARKEYPKPMPWVLNCSQCSFFTQEMMEEFSSRSILYLDADAEMIRRPSLFLDGYFPYDFAAPFLTNDYVNNELVSNTLYFAGTPSSKELVDRWAEEQRERNNLMLQGKYKSPFHAAWDQQVLQDVFTTVPNLRCGRLPWTYGKIDPTCKGVELMKNVNPEEVVIRQHQASRQNKGWV